MGTARPPSQHQDSTHRYPKAPAREEQPSINNWRLQPGAAEEEQWNRDGPVPC